MTARRPAAALAAGAAIVACLVAGLVAPPVEAQEPPATSAAPTTPAPASRLREAPLWELGAGVVTLSMPHYRGSEQSRAWVLPVPYFVYRGRFLRADREGARAVLLERRALEIDLSVAGSAPARSDGNRARSGMPDLAPTFEFGPNVNLTLARGADWKVELRAPVRAAFTVQGRSEHIGWTASPYLSAGWMQSGWDVGVRLGGLWGDRRFHGYTYDVASEYATAMRPAYRAAGGRSGWQATAGATRRFGPWWVGTFVRADSVRGAAFAASPLVTRPDTWAAGIAVSYVFARSPVMVKVPD
ncbi:MAG: MipA/OmpV family protein [Rubrivivax sp.]|nr:MipA/OmpV family protein [Rubrivivax sp.]